MSIKNLETYIVQLSKQIASFPSSSGGFTCNAVDNPKKEMWEVVETDLGFVSKKGEAERVKGIEIKKNEGVSEKEDSENQGCKEEKGVTIDQLIDKNSPWRRKRRKF